MLIKMLVKYPSYSINNSGCVINMKTNYVLRSRNNKNGYAMILLSDSNGKRNWVLINDLMKATFSDEEFYL